MSEFVMVKRELLEWACESVDDCISINESSRLEELRAVLAQEAGCQDGSALMKIAADLTCRRPLSRLQRICEGTGKINIEHLAEDVDKCGDLLAGIALDIRRAITSPPAPVAVVLPDIDVFIEDVLGLSARRIASGDYQSFGASCAARAIDKVKELNQ